MAMSALTDDLDVIFSTADFAITASITIAATPATVSISGIFDREDVPTDDQLAGGFAAYVKHTQFTCATADVPGIAVNDTVTVDGTTYYVALIVNDGQGVLELQLATEAS